MNIFDTTLKKTGQTLTVIRNNVTLNTYIGAPNHEKTAYDFYSDADIKIGDWLVNSCNSKYFVKNVELKRMRDNVVLRAFIIPEWDYKNIYKDQTINNFNINTANNSVIGTQSNFTFNVNTELEKLTQQINNSDSPDKEELLQLISELKTIISSDKPLKRGMLSKFSSVLQRNSWVTSPIATAVLTLLMQIPM